MVSVTSSTAASVAKRLYRLIIHTYCVPEDGRKTCLHRDAHTEISNTSLTSIDIAWDGRCTNTYRATVSQHCYTVVSGKAVLKSDAAAEPHLLHRFLRPLEVQKQVWLWTFCGPE